jgi:hypothetical protein
MKGELVTFKNTDNRLLDGVLYEDKINKVIVIHIHGSSGNFYQNQFIRKMAYIYNKNHIDMLSFNLTGHDGIAEGYRNGDFEYIGGSVTHFEECIADLDGAINFVSSLGKRIILQGHSLGCDRIVHYLVKSRKSYDFILLSPCDSYALQKKYISPETIEEQIQRLKSLNCEEPHQLLRRKEYGVRQYDEDYFIPISRDALLNILEGPPLKLFRIDQPLEYFIDSHCLTYIGGRDSCQSHKSEVVFHHIANRTKSLKRLYIEDGEHDLERYEDFIATQICEWIKSKHGTD